MRNRDDVNDFKYDFNPTADGGFALEHKLEPSPLTGKRAKEFMDKNTVIVTINDIEYKADTVSIAYMSSVMTIANAKFNMGLAAGQSATDLYTAIYEQTIPWANKQGKLTLIKLADIPDAIKTAMDKIAKITGVK